MFRLSCIKLWLFSLCVCFICLDNQYIHCPHIWSEYVLHYGYRLWVHPDMDFFQADTSALLSTNESSAIVAVHRNSALHDIMYPFETFIIKALSKAACFLQAAEAMCFVGFFSSCKVHSDKPDTSRRPPLPWCPWCSRVPFTKKKKPWCPFPFKNEAHRPLVRFMS